MEKDGQKIDDELYAIALCVEGLDHIKHDPIMLSRVVRFVSERYIGDLRVASLRIDTAIKALKEKVTEEAQTRYASMNAAEIAAEYGHEQ